MGMTGGSGIRHTQPPKHQTDAALNQAAPVQNTWYTVLDTTKNVRVYGITVLVADVGETLELRLTIDGKTEVAGFAANANTAYYTYSDIAYDQWALGIGATTYHLYRSFLLDCRALKVELRKTTAAGAGNIRACVVFGQW